MAPIIVQDGDGSDSNFKAQSRIYSKISLVNALAGAFAE